MAKNWYILQTYTGYEAKIERIIKGLLEKRELRDDVVLDTCVPTEEVAVLQKDGKQKIRKEKFLPGYLLLEMDLPETDWKDTCAIIRSIQGVNGFVGTEPKEHPRAISADEAKAILQRSGLIKGEKPVHVQMAINVGDEVKITDGPFASFTGKVNEVNAEKEKLRVTVQIFGRDTPVELNFGQVERSAINGA